VDDAAKREIDAMSGFSAIHASQRRDKRAALDAVLFLLATLTLAGVACATRPHASPAVPATHELPSR
jgi:hypothetical protein